MARKKKKKELPMKHSITTNVAAEIAASVGSSREGRDKLTRVTSPIKGMDTHSRQWMRWSP